MCSHSRFVAWLGVNEELEQQQQQGRSAGADRLEELPTCDAYVCGRKSASAFCSQRKCLDDTTSEPLLLKANLHRLAIF